MKKMNEMIDKVLNMMYLISCSNEIEKIDFYEMKNTF